jgi:hypothetical protein
MEILADIVKIIVPGSLVLVGIYLTVRTLTMKQLESQLLQIRAAASDQVLPIRLQAYERIILLLERSSPMQLLLRTNQPGMNAFMLKQQMQIDLQEELNHNIAQQTYMSHEVWMAVKAAVNQVSAIIESAADDLAPNAGAMEYIERLTQTLMQYPNDPCLPALIMVKAEVQRLF